MKVILLTGALLAQLSGGSSLCVPDCSLSSEGGKVADPTNCLRYYYCSDPDGDGSLVPSLSPTECDEGHYFNSVIADCISIVQGDEYCTGLCTPCEVECELPGTLIPNPWDCHLYTVCLDNGETLKASCSFDLPYYDYVTGLCSDDPAVCYDICDPCEPYCAEEGKVPDPQNCHGYYYCDPPVLSPFSCPDGEVFNAESLICEQALEPNCTNLCSYQPSMFCP